jgi:hypothetical protein
MFDAALFTYADSSCVTTDILSSRQLRAPPLCALRSPPLPSPPLRLAVGPSRRSCCVRQSCTGCQNGHGGTSHEPLVDAVRSHRQQRSLLQRARPEMAQGVGTPRRRQGCWIRLWGTGLPGQQGGSIQVDPGERRFRMERGQWRHGAGGHQAAIRSGEASKIRISSSFVLRFIRTVRLVRFGATVR